MIGKIYNYIKGKQEIVYRFYENSHFMSSGTYVFDESIKYIRIVDDDTKKHSSEILHQNRYRNVSSKICVFLLKKLLFRKSITIQKEKNELSNFSGTVFLPVGSANGYSDKKIFDFETERVLTIFSDKKDYNNHLSHYAYFKNYFPLPEIVWTKSKDLLLIEELIFLKPYNQWCKEDFLFVMRDIFNRYHNYFIDCYRKGNYVLSSPNQLFVSLSNGFEMDFIKKSIHNELLDLKFPCIKLHGDLWTANTLLDKHESNKVMYIDWEYSNEFLFFYDFFNVMWLEVYMYDNDFYIKRYFEGEYDVEFSNVFSIFDLTYHPEYRLTYFYIFFLNFMKERFKTMSGENQQIYYHQYRNLIEKLFI
jgi:hypothetical protein